MRFSTLLGLAPFIASAFAAPYNETYASYNLNTNQNAQSPLDYDTSFVPSRYHPSPSTWRFPFYTILMDKFADGDPTNNDYFKSPFEWDWRETNFRFGGDLAGLESKLDYLAGMGIKGIFAAGTPWINMLWQADSAPMSYYLFSLLQLTFLFLPPLRFRLSISALSFADCVDFPYAPVSESHQRPGFQATPHSTLRPSIPIGASATNGGL